MMRRLWLAIGIALIATVLAIAAACYHYYFNAKHVIFSSSRDGLIFKAYCQYRGTFIFGTYLEVSGGSHVISVNELPPSTDDLTDCRVRFPISDIQPDETYSYLTVSFAEGERRPLTIPLALTGLDLPDRVRRTIEKTRGCSYYEATCY